LQISYRVAVASGKVRNINSDYAANINIIIIPRQSLVASLFETLEFTSNNVHEKSISMTLPQAKITIRHSSVKANVCKFYS